MKGWYTAAQVIDEALMISGDWEKKRYEDAVLHFARCYRNYQLFHATSFVKTWLPVSAIRTVALPDDFMRLVYIGTSINGEVFTFTMNGRIASPSAPLEDVLITSRNEDDDLDVSPLEGYAAKGVNIYEYFNVDEKKKRIELKQAFLNYYNQSDVTEVMIGYVGTGLTDINNSLIPNVAVNMITNDIAYNLALSAQKKDYNLIQLLRINSQQEALKFDALSLPTVDELMDAIYETSGQSVRR